MSGDRSLAAALADRHAGTVTARALVEAALDRIAVADRDLNAFVRLDDRAALEAADREDAGVPSPLAGVPLAHKDMFFRKGRVSTCGSRGFAERQASETASVLARLDGAGAIDLGTLNMAEFAHNSTGHNAFLGAACNPWNPAHMTGGSSSGSGAAVAAGMVFAALGSDTGGSIRLPAHFCGVTGLKPTQGLVTRGGTMPLSFSLDTIGPLARSAEDVAIVLEHLVGADTADPTAEAVTGARYRVATADPVEGRVVGIPDAFYFEDLSADVARAVEATRGELERLGVRVVDVRLPDQAPLVAGQLVLVASEACSQHRDRLVERPDDFEPMIRNRLVNGFGYTALDYLEALRSRGPALAAHLAATEGVDAILAPVAPFDAPTLAETDVGGDPGAEALTRSISRFMRPANYIGTPAMAFPAGFSGRNLPVGLQLIGRPFGEDVLFALVGALQRATDHHRQRPPH